MSEFELQLLSNGAHHVRVTASGHGFSSWKGLAVTRWCEDATLDGGGTRCHVLDHVAPAGEPTGEQRKPRPSKTGGHDFRDGRAIVWWRYEGLEIRSEIAVSADDPLELRRVVITNLREERRTLSATTYAEIVFSPPATDSAHPAFSKLFVETEVDPVLQAILATRRPSTPADPTPWFFQTARVGNSEAGSGDWNDGMNHVGAEGRGESVWMAFFLFDVLRQFAPLARLREDLVFAERCETEAKALRTRIEASAWDGAWYRRAWFDDGTVLGSAENTECRIDSIAQSWSVLSGAAPADRAQRAMASLDQHLVNRDVRLVQLLDPPFDTSDPSPGYIQGYVPGVRENGGQYTHAAVWAAMAFAALGDADRAWELCAMLNPLRYAGGAVDVATYQVEPYVMAGDVYANAAHAGRGGWTWYTGSAGWMAQFIVESLLGLQRRGNQLRLRPLLPKPWTTFDMSYRFGNSTFAITCRQAAAGMAQSVVADGVETLGDTLTLIDDGRSHVAVVTVARRH